MHVLIVYAHQEPKSFNGALKDTAVKVLEDAGHVVEVSDLYAMDFNPLVGKGDITRKLQNPEKEAEVAYFEGRLSPDITAEQDKLLRADLVIFQFPMYWFSAPAIMKGWWDRVFKHDQFYDAGLKGKKAVLSITTGGSRTMFSTTGIFGDMEIYLWPIQNGALSLAGFDVLAPQISYGPANVSDTERTAMLDSWVTRLRTIESEQGLAFLKMRDFDMIGNQMLTKQMIQKAEQQKTGLTIGHRIGKPI